MRTLCDFRITLETDELDGDLGTAKRENAKTEDDYQVGSVLRVLVEVSDPVVAGASMGR